jgi:hypothetical protein
MLGLLVEVSLGQESGEALAAEGFVQPIEGTALDLDMVAVPGGTLSTVDPESGEAREIEIAPVFLAAREIAWVR